MNTKRFDLKKLYSPVTIFVIFYFFMLVFHFQMTNTYGDDAAFSKILLSESLFEFAKRHYLTWSARNLVEMLFVSVEALPHIIWQLINPAIISVSAFAMYKLSSKEPSKTAAFVSCSLVFFYSWFHMYTAGWVTTMMVYLWTFAAGALALMCAKSSLEQNKIKPVMFVLSCLAVIYSANMEQMAIFLLIILSSALIYELIVKKRFDKLISAQLICALANLIYAALCPGTSARVESSIVSVYKNFEAQSFFEKVEKGVSYSLHNSVFTLNLASLAFCAILAIAVFTKSKNILMRLCALFPLVLTFVCGFLGLRLQTIIPWISSLINMPHGVGYLGLTNCNNLFAYLPFLLLCFVLLAWILSLYAAFGHCEKTIAAIVILLAGFCSCAALGFSPTVGASGPRTAFFFSFSQIFLSLMLFNDVEIKWLRKAIAFGTLPFIAFQIYIFVQGFMYPPYQ